MPISLDSFQRTLNTSNAQGFVKLSNDGAGVKSVGGGFFARHFGFYTKPTAEENNAVRRAFYESVANGFHCQGEVLDKLRHDLGIGADGTSTSGARLSVGDAQEILKRVKAGVDEQSENVKARKDLMESLKTGGFLKGAIRQHVQDMLKLDDPAAARKELPSADARAIRHYAMDAHTNFTVRDNLYKQLEEQGLCQGEVGAQVRAMLNLDDDEKVLEPLPKAIRDSVVAFAKDNSAAVHAERIATLKLPSEEDLANLVAPEKLHGFKAILANAGATMEQLVEVARAINEFSVGQEHESWSAQVDGALAQLSSDVGADCSSMKDAILSGIENGLLEKYNGAKDSAAVSKEQVRGDFTAALAKVIDDKKAMKACLDEAAPRLPRPVVDYLRGALATSVAFGSPAQMKALADNFDAAVPLQSLRFADNVTEEGYLGALATMKEKMGADVIGNQGSKLLCKMFLDIGKLAVEAGRADPLPGADCLKPMMSKHASQLAYVRQQIKQGGEFCCGPAALGRGIDADLMILGAFAEHYGLGDEVSDAKPASGPDRTLSPSLEKMLEDSGVSHGNKRVDDGRHFDFTLRSAFQESMLTLCEGRIACADDTDKYPDIPTAFKQCFMDCTRAGCGIKVDGTVVAYVNDSVATEGKSEAFQGMSAKLEEFFGADEVNGMRAARIIGEITHQGFFADVMKSVKSSGELAEIPAIMDTDHAMDFSVRRGEDGSYGIHFTGMSLYRFMPDANGDMKWLDPSQSKVTFELDLTLSFDAESGKPSISFANPPTMSGKLTPSGLGMLDCPALQRVTDPGSGSSFISIAEMSGALHNPELRNAVFGKGAAGAKPEDVDKLFGSRLLTEDDFRLLKTLGYDDSVVMYMISGMAGDDSTPRLDKGLVGRLKDPETRGPAMLDLAKVAAPLVEREWIPGMPDVGPEMINLITVAGLSTASCNDRCDAVAVANFIRQSNDLDVEMLPADLQSDDPKVVEVAKMRIHQIDRDLRLEEGVNILRSHLSDITGADIALLRKHVDATQYQHLLLHIAERDAFLDDALQTFQDLIASAKIIEKGMNAQRQQ